MKVVEPRDATDADLNREHILEQLQRIVQDEVFRSSKRSIAFLTYVVQETLKHTGEQIKERTIGIEVFGRQSSYDTSLDHIVRTAATEVRKRLAIYYGSEQRRGELRINLVPGSYMPRFTPASLGSEVAPEPIAPPHIEAVGSIAAPGAATPGTPEQHTESFGKPRSRGLRWALLCLALIVAGGLGVMRWRSRSPDELFWESALDTPGPVLLAVGDVPSGPPTLPDIPNDPNLPVPRAARSEAVPFGDVVTIARVVGSLEGHGKKVEIRRESTSSFSDLRQGAVVLIGAFNNEWSLRLTHPLRYSLALDPAQHLIYIRDSKNPQARNWSWATNQSPMPQTGINSPTLQDYALISRVQSSETGHVVVVIGGLYTYGTESAGEFLTNPQELRGVVDAVRQAGPNGNLQIVLGTTVTDGIPGPPRVVAVSSE